jgi:hypothetical protein
MKRKKEQNRAEQSREREGGGWYLLDEGKG